VLAELATIVTLETLLRWHRQLIAQRNCHRSGHFHLKNVDALRDFDTCFFRLGVSSVGMSAEDYRRLTYDLTLTVARQLLPGNPRLVFEYISGGGNRCQFAAEVGTCRG
jgi:hypothetical protein